MMNALSKRETQYMFTCTSASFSILAAGLFWRSQLQGAQGGRVNSTAKLSAPAGLRRSCSERVLARFKGIAFREAEAKQVHGNPKL